jgi:hypothetical protein
MRLLRVPHIVAVGIMLAALVTVGASPAQAAQVAQAAAGHGSIGEAHAWVGGQQIDVVAQAPCAIGGSAEASTPGVAVAGFVKFGIGNSTCNVDAASGAASIRVSGSGFRFDGLKAYGGPTIKLSTFTATCGTTATGSGSTIRLAGLSGFQLPNPVPTNHVVTIPGALPQDPPIATITVNEMITPTPADGSMTVNALHIRLFPEGVALDHGDIVVGTVHCSPFDD